MSRTLNVRVIRWKLMDFTYGYFLPYIKANCFIGFFLVCLNQTGLCQNYEIEGRVLHRETKAPIPYANVYNQNLNSGTISNTDGFFKIPVQGVSDTICISFIGFQEHYIPLQENIGFYTILLDESTLELQEVTITPKDNAFLYKLLQACRKSASKMESTSRAYYALTSNIDNKQVELLEGYYNADLRGYELKDIHLKAGRVALQPFENRFFASLESSKAIAMLDVMDQNDYFPLHPVAMSPRKMKKNYHLTLNSKYLDGDKDSVYVITYAPKDTSGLFFAGDIWLNKSKNQIVKIIYNCSNAQKHPFLPVFPTDSILNVSFDITQTFKNSGDHAVFNHIDFEYSITYKSRIGKSEEQRYAIKTTAVLYAYDSEKAFFIPAFDFNDNSAGDYRKINAFPYNDFFWRHNDSFRLHDSLNTNEGFFEDSKSITNKTLFKSNTFVEEGLFEHPYVHWSDTRIKFRDIMPDTAAQSFATAGIKSEQYNLAVKIYLDINSYRDSTHIVTAAIFDPYQSYYHLPMDTKTHCFVNMYFDLCEIKRRVLEEKLNAERNNLQRVKVIYDNFQKELESDKFDFMKEVQRGEDEKGMMKYNDIVMRELGINNIELFQPFGSED